MTNTLAHDIAHRICTFNLSEYEQGNPCVEICCWCAEQAQSLIDIFNAHKELGYDEQSACINRGPDREA